VATRRIIRRSSHPFFQISRRRRSRACLDRSKGWRGTPSPLRHQRAIGSQPVPAGQ
jgi:hypothetical protein